MALRELVDGDCGAPSSVMHLTSHFIQDHGFKEEGIHHPFKVDEQLPIIDSDQLVNKFLEEKSCPQTFRMDSIIQEMREIDHNIHPFIPKPGVVEELAISDTAWANQYLESGKHFQEHHKDDIWNTTGMKRHVHVIQDTHELGLGPKWAEEYFEHSIDSLQNDINENNSNDNIKSFKSPNLAHSKFMKFMRQEEKDDVKLENNQASESSIKTNEDEEWTEEFLVDQEIPETLSPSNNIENKDKNAVLNEVEEELAAAGTWVEELSKENSTEEIDNYESTFWTRFQNEWNKISSRDDLSTVHPWISEFESYYDPFTDYNFNTENPMKTLPNSLEEGKKRLEAGDLPSAVLCFEAAVQEDENNAEAWLLLGKSQTESEQDPLAIPALKRCLSLDPTNSVALMALAVSYTNESYQNQACLTLKEWLLKNENYKHLSIEQVNKDELIPKPSVSTILFNNIHEEVKKLYIEAARMNPEGQIDADVQCGLGVLLNLSNEHSKAADCFQAALQARPDDYRLWNRLGASLANGQRSEEAVHAYHRALELSPGFIRARYNLGISCINLGAYKEAGEHLLIALNQQAAGRGTKGEKIPPRAMSNAIWSTLRLVVSLMHQYKLNEAIEDRDLPKLNEEFGIV